MLYREAGQFKTSYEADAAVFPLRQDRIGIAVILFLAIVVVPLFASDFTLSSVLIPILIPASFRSGPPASWGSAPMRATS